VSIKGGAEIEIKNKTEISVVRFEGFFQ